MFKQIAVAAGAQQIGSRIMMLADMNALYENGMLPIRPTRAQADGQYQILRRMDEMADSGRKHDQPHGKQAKPCCQTFMRSRGHNAQY
ncbi:hypothetical protein SAMN04488135_101301 [Pollutimonas bauzanensis]|uniref:Uncharacterized protein n=1 Tax=Pollutimonas bauzanensis TaxID=658167 RepID=A0A1M5MRE3_9BURK|nr:hypothetical protein SAMN04488135_101301 [Pollutimonas bauzanensis]